MSKYLELTSDLLRLIGESTIDEQVADTRWWTLDELCDPTAAFARLHDDELIQEVEARGIAKATEDWLHRACVPRGYCNFLPSCIIDPSVSDKGTTEEP